MNHNGQKNAANWAVSLTSNRSLVAEAVLCLYNATLMRFMLER